MMVSWYCERKYMPSDAKILAIWLYDRYPDPQPLTYAASKLGISAKEAYGLSELLVREGWCSWIGERSTLRLYLPDEIIASKIRSKLVEVSNNSFVVSSVSLNGSITVESLVDEWVKRLARPPFGRVVRIDIAGRSIQGRKERSMWKKRIRLEQEGKISSSRLWRFLEATLPTENELSGLSIWSENSTSWFARYLAWENERASWPHTLYDIVDLWYETHPREWEWGAPGLRKLRPIFDKLMSSFSKEEILSRIRSSSADDSPWDAFPQRQVKSLQPRSESQGLGKDKLDTLRQSGAVRG